MLTRRSFMSAGVALGAQSIFQTTDALFSSARAVGPEIVIPAIEKMLEMAEKAERMAEAALESKLAAEGRRKIDQILTLQAKTIAIVEKIDAGLREIRTDMGQSIIDGSVRLTGKQTKTANQDIQLVANGVVKAQTNKVPLDQASWRLFETAVGKFNLAMEWFTDDVSDALKSDIGLHAYLRNWRNALMLTQICALSKKVDAAFPDKFKPAIWNKDQYNDSAKKLHMAIEEVYNFQRLSLLQDWYERETTALTALTTHPWSGGAANGLSEAFRRNIADGKAEVVDGCVRTKSNFHSENHEFGDLTQRLEIYLYSFYRGAFLVTLHRLGNSRLFVRNISLWGAATNSPPYYEARAGWYVLPGYRTFGDWHEMESYRRSGWAKGEHNVPEADLGGIELCQVNTNPLFPEYSADTASKLFDDLVIKSKTHAHAVLTLETINNASDCYSGLRTALMDIYDPDRKINPPPPPAEGPTEFEPPEGPPMRPRIPMPRRPVGEGTFEDIVK